jgi:UDP-2-acetamido-2-deoxy-ribo-hexuluronate aminotransferase
MRQQVGVIYNQLLNQALIDTIPFIESHNTSVYAQYTIRVKDREVVQARLKVAEIPTAVHYPIPLNKQPAVANEQASLPVGDQVAQQVMSLPFSPYLSSGDQAIVVEILSKTLSER